jgi:quinol monooxygenase YgiN
MIIRIVKMEFKPEKTDEFLSIFNQSHDKIRSSKGCMNLSLVRDINDPGIFFTISHWESSEALDAYRKSNLFISTWSKTKILFKEKAQAWSTDVHNAG